MRVGVLTETFPTERRVAVTPAVAAALLKADMEVLVENGCGLGAGFADEQYTNAGARVMDRATVFARADVLLTVRGPGANPDGEDEVIGNLRPGQIIIGHLDPLGRPHAAQKLASSGALGFALELMPRITRAQSMDTLSSMATIAGYKGVLLAATHLPKMFPMMMTAAGSISPAHVFILGAGVAGLQAIATAKRLGAVVEAFDIRPEVKEQVKSVGGKFVELEIESEQAGDEGGYAKEQSEDFYAKQQALMTERLQAADVVITTAAVPGRRAPVLVTAEMVEGMRPGSIIVDLAAETGGNCELTRAGETVEHAGIKIIGPVNLPATVPQHASQMYAKNITTFLNHLRGKSEQLDLDLDDEITRTTLVTRDGDIVNERVREALEQKKGAER